MTPFDHYDPKPYRVRLRRGSEFGDVKPEAEQLDGKVHLFRYGWTIDDDERYPGEIAMMLEQPLDPDVRFKRPPGWLASGDLEAA